MDAKDYADWLRREHERAGELAATLRDKVALIPRGGFERWLGELRGCFDHLRAHMEKHMALEERGGYLASVLERRPTLSSAVERLRNEHRELTRIMTGIHQALHEIAASDHLLIRDCCSRIEGLLRHLEQHESRENLLVLSVYTDDMGANT